MEIIKSHAGTKQHIPEASNRGTGGNTQVNPGTNNARAVTPNSTPRVSHLSQAQLDDVLATRSAMEFVSECGSFYPCPANSAKMQAYVRQHDLPPHLVNSWWQAFDALSLANELAQRPAPVAPAEVDQEFQPRPTEKSTDGTVKSFHDPKQIEALKNLSMKELKRMVAEETSAKRSALVRRGVRL